jgi:hypothetical protein
MVYVCVELSVNMVVLYGVANKHLILPIGIRPHCGAGQYAPSTKHYLKVNKTCYMFSLSYSAHATVGTLSFTTTSTFHILYNTLLINNCVFGLS